MSKSQDKWKQLRLRPEAHARLAAFIDRLQENVRERPGRYPPWLTSGQISFSDAILWLMFQQDEHAARSYSERARKGGKPGRRKEATTDLEPMMEVL